MIIEDIHKKLNHRNWEDTRKEFLRQNWFYFGYVNDIKYIISKCSICLQKNRKFYKREPSKIILFERPKDRYLIDLTELPVEFKKANNCNYICNIIDHFSRLCKSYIIPNKKANIIINCIIDFINIYGVPLSITSDNGREFKNKTIIDFMIKKNIKFLHWLQYKPHSQGVVERVHKTIKTSLIIKKLELGNEKEIDLDNIIKNINQVYNNTIHSVLKATPNEVFFSTNEKFLKIIKKKCTRLLQ